MRQKQNDSESHRLVGSYNNNSGFNPNQDKNNPRIPNVVCIYNIPDHGNKDDIVYFIFKNLQNIRGTLRKSVNPISRSQLIPDKKCLFLQFKTRQEALNCLQLDGLFYGNRSFQIKSQLKPRDNPKLDLRNLKIRKVQSKVQEGFYKIFVGNLPDMQHYQVLDMLSNIGQVKAVQKITTTSSQNQYFCEFKVKQRTDEYLAKLNELKIKGRSVIAKRSVLMNTSQTSKSKVVKARRSVFQKDLGSFYLTLDTQGYFHEMKISCVLLLKNIISNFHVKEEIMKDLQKEIKKIGPIVKMQDYERNVYIEFEKVEYAQIAYLVISQRKFQNRPIDISFYDPIHFADELLV